MSQDMFTKADLHELNAAIATLISVVHRIGGDVGMIIQLPDRREHVVQPLSTVWAVGAWKRARQTAKARLSVIDAAAVEVAIRQAHVDVAKDAKREAAARTEAEQEEQSADE